MYRVQLWINDQSQDYFIADTREEAEVEAWLAATAFPDPKKVYLSVWELTDKLRQTWERVGSFTFEELTQ